MNHLFDFSDQICYVQCALCDTILLVGVPCSSLSMVVTVRCGHCTTLLSVNMMKVTFVPFHHLFANSLSRDDHHHQKEEVISPELGDTQKNFETRRSSLIAGSFDHIVEIEEEEEDQDIYPVNPVINKPPEKRQRAPSAYNCFIKEEIKRLKAENPNMAHKQAFSTAAKNWANFPPIHRKENGDHHHEDFGHEEENLLWNFDDAAYHQVNIEGNNERKSSSYSLQHMEEEKDTFLF